jgi:hypothetical protein
MAIYRAMKPSPSITLPPDDAPSAVRSMGKSANLFGEQAVFLLRRR